MLELVLRRAIGVTQLSAREAAKLGTVVTQRCSTLFAVVRHRARMAPGAS